MHYRLWLTCVLLPLTVEGLQSASFYGESYIRLPLSDVGDTTILQLQFRTHRATGLMFYALGRHRHYCSVELKGGHVKAKIKMGSDVLTLRSVANNYNDFLWHDVKLERSEREMTLTLDYITKTTGNVTGLSQLSIDRGLFIGGGQSNFKSFRGCIKGLTFNSVDVMDRVLALTVSHQDLVHHVSWGCSNEFSWSADKAISFTSNTSYIAFPRDLVTNGISFSFNLKTRTSNGVLFFGTGISALGQFVSLQIKDGVPSLSCDKGQGATVVQSTKKISDGMWHHLKLEVGRVFMTLTIDGVRESRSFFDLDTSYITLEGKIYVGGVSEMAVNESQALVVGPLTSIVGCYKNFKMQEKSVGLPDVDTSYGIKTDCLWNYPCSFSPCTDGSTCIEVGYDKFRCVCDDVSCVKSTTDTMTTRVSKNNILLLRPLTVKEGSSKALSTDIIQLGFNRKELHIRESAIFFHVKGKPHYGNIKIEVKRRSSERSFTLLDLKLGKVTYLHDGSEYLNDSVEFEFEIFGRRNLPSNLQSKTRFSLNIKVMAVNDVPQIRLPPGGILKIAQAKHYKFTQKDFLVNDPDNIPRDLMVDIMYPEGSILGHLEHSDNPGQKMRKFSQKDLNDGKVDLVFNDYQDLNIAFQASDGTAQSVATVLRIIPEPLRLILQNNTGIDVYAFHSVLIASQNLSTTSNSPDFNYDIKYIITENPTLGVIQRFKPSVKEWQNVKQFRQSHLLKKTVRYLHLRSDHVSTDSFKMKATAKNVRSKNFVFAVNVTKLNINIVANDLLILNGSREKEITTLLLKSISNWPALNTTEIKYTILKPPSRGALLQHRKTILTFQSSFSQYDIDNGSLKYRIHRSSNSPKLDHFKFRVSVIGGNSVVGTFEIKYLPTETDFSIINNGLDKVLEGRRHAITNENLYVETNASSNINYKIISYPQHGKISLVASTKEFVIAENVSEFTNQNIIDKQVFYTHDDSENSFDSFTFKAAAIIKGTAQSEHTEKFSIDIILLNDNAPQRKVDKVFSIVRNRERVITSEDLSFYDPDVNFNSKNLHFSRRRLANGDIVFIANGSKAYNWRQDDLDNKRLMYIHSGRDFGRSLIMITDGQLQSAALFEVKATDPFIAILNNTGIHVTKGRSTILTNHNISIETNMNAKEKDVAFYIISPPRYGDIMVNNRDVGDFTVADVIAGIVTYKHDNSINLQDKFKFAVRINNTQVQGDVDVTVLLPSQQLPPVIVHNIPVLVEENGIVVIDNNHLLTNHSDTNPGGIIYTIKTEPKLGHLSVGSKANVNKFSQSDINTGLLHYTHQTRGQLMDSFIFDVSNDIKKLINIHFVFEIVPSVVPVYIQNITVSEGGQKAIVKSYICVRNRHFNNHTFIYDIIKKPQHGRFEMVGVPGGELNKFTSKQVQNEFIYYVHDGSETSHDYVTVVARSKQTGKRTLPSTLFINITPVNDKQPVVTRNNGIQVWVGSTTTLTSSQLKATDEDNTPANITFEVTSPTNGYFALTTAPDEEIGVFTQLDIDNERILFIHKGHTTGDFLFQLNDGIHYGDRHTFYIMATQLQLNQTILNDVNMYPHSIQPIRADNLKVMTNDPNQTNPIVFTITTKAIYGDIITIVNGTDLPVTSFTQREVNSGIIAYKHTAITFDWEQTDEITFVTSAEYAKPLDSQVLSFFISYQSDNSGNSSTNPLVETKQLMVAEGGESKISSSNIDLSKLVTKFKSSTGHNRGLVKFFIISLPQHGFLKIDEQNATVGDYFVEPDLKQGRVEYFHDHSDSLWDMFGFTPRLTGAPGSHLPVFNLTYNITIQPVNDQPFKVLTRNPIIGVLQGSKVTVTPDVLQTTDQDTLPEHITYKVINQPKNGNFMKDNAIISTFTQADIDESYLVFASNGITNTNIVHVRVTDGAFDAFYLVITVNVIPLVVNIVHNTGANIIQSHVTTIIDSKMLSTTTNGNKTDIEYNITSRLQFGALYIGDIEVTYFTQDDIDLQNVIYLQTDMTGGSDNFTFSVYNKLTKQAASQVTSSQEVTSVFNISVVPLVKQMPFNISLGDSVQITTKSLDAIELYIASNSMPFYTVIHPPIYGELTVKSKAKRDVHTNKTSFSHQDIVDGKVYYTVDVDKMKDFPKEDSFVYRLTSGNSQPAIGEFIITLQPPRPTTTVLQITLSNENSSVTPWINVGSHNNNSHPNNTLTSSSVTDILYTTTANPGIIYNTSDKDLARSVKDESTNENTIYMIIALIGGLLLISVVVITLVLLKRKQDRERDKPYMNGRNKTDAALTRANVHVEPRKVSLSAHDIDMRGNSIPVKTSSLDGSTNFLSSDNPVRTPDLSRTEISRTVPQCKVTPLVAVDSSAPNGTRTTVVSPEKSPHTTGSGNNNLDIDSIDPEIIWDSLHDPNPALRNSLVWL